MRSAMWPASVSEGSAGVPGAGDWRISGCTIRLGEYVLITAAAAGVQMTCDCARGRLAGVSAGIACYQNTRGGG